MSSFILNNVVVSSHARGIVSLTPIALLRKRGISTTGIPQKSFGSKLMDNVILGQISNCILHPSQVM